VSNPGPSGQPKRDARTPRGGRVGAGKGTAVGDADGFGANMGTYGAT
jgi:hypothetical protein